MQPRATLNQQDSHLLSDLEKLELILAHLTSGKAFQLDLLEYPNTASSTLEIQEQTSKTRRSSRARKSDVVMTPDLPGDDIVMSVSPSREAEAHTSAGKGRISLRD